MMGSVYALKGQPDLLDVTPDLLRGKGRFGWSYEPTADLRRLRQRIDDEGWDSLSEEEKDCYRGQEFLLDLQTDDYVIYINIPQPGQCTLARVTGGYFFRHDSSDFNHRFSVDTDSVRTFDRNAPFVHPALRARLKLPRRWWTITKPDAFGHLLEVLDDPYAHRSEASRSNTAFLNEAITPYLTDIAHEIHRSHPNKDLESFIAEVFQQIPTVKGAAVQRGRADKGADLLVTFESGLPVPGLEDEQVLLIQAKSYEGHHADPEGIEALVRAFKAHDADMALLISTASSVSPEVDQLAELRSEELGKPIKVLAGPDFARLVLAQISRS